MKINPLTLVGTALLWIGTLAGAYHFGKQQPSPEAAASQDGLLPASRSGATAPTPGSGKVASGKSGLPTTPDGKVSLKSLFAKLSGIMRTGGMQNPRAMMKAMALLEEVPASQVKEALAEAEGMKDAQAKMMIMMTLLGKWAETDGPAAMAYATENSKGLGMMAQMVKVGAAAAWAEKDPEAVWKWYQEQQDDPNNNSQGVLGGSSMVLMTLFNHLAASDPEAAFKRLSEIDESARTMALSGIGQAAMSDESKRDQLLGLINTLPSPAEKSQAQNMIVSQWAMMDPDKAIDWVRNQPDDQQKQLKAPLASVLMMQNPQKGAELMMEGATDENRREKVSGVVAHWAHQDLNGAGDWLKKQPPGAYLDSAKSVFISVAAERDGESALAWAATVEEPTAKFSATTTAYQAWSKKQPAEADAALEKMGFTPEQLTQIKTKPTPGAPPTTSEVPAPPTAVLKNQ